MMTASQMPNRSFIPRDGSDSQPGLTVLKLPNKPLSSRLASFKSRWIREGRLEFTAMELHGSVAEVLRTTVAGTYRCSFLKLSTHRLQLMGSPAAYKRESSSLSVRVDCTKRQVASRRFDPSHISRLMTGPRAVWPVSNHAAQCRVP